MLKKAANYSLIISLVILIGLAISQLGTPPAVQVGSGGPEQDFAFADILLTYKKTILAMDESEPETKIINYEVEPGDTLSGIAARFDTDVASIMYNNNLNSETIQPGQTLRILTIKGIIHQVRRGENLWYISRLYGVGMDKVVSANGLTDPDRLIPGMELIVPDGKPANGTNATTAGSSASMVWPVYGQITSGYGYRIHPISGSREFHTGLDIGAPYGRPVRAALPGTVIYAGLRGGYGLTVMIKHANGVVTLYGHMSSILVEYGQQVSRGQYIGKIGSTGVSTGPHIHFEVRVNGSPQNPLNFLP